MTEQVANIISKVRNYHHELGRQYMLLAQDGKQPPPVTMVLNYLSEKENEIVKVLDCELELENFPNIYQTWLKEKPSRLEDIIESYETEPTDDQPEVFEALQMTVINQHRCVIELYQQLSEICPAESLSNYFQSLADREARVLEKMVDNINQCRNM